MKVLFLVTVTDLEGSTYSLFQLIEGLMSRGVEIMVLATRKGYYCEVMEEKNIPYKIIRYRNSLYPRLKTLRDAFYYLPMLILLLENKINYFKVLKAVKEFAPDIVHTNVSPIVIGYRAAKELNIPHVWHIREYLDKDFNIHPFPTKNSLYNKLKESYSIAITKDVKKHFGLGDKCMCIYDGIYHESEIIYNSKKKPYFLFVGFIMECKGVYDLIDAYIHYAKNNSQALELYLVGGYQSEDYNRIQTILKENNIIDSVHLTGKLPINEVKKYMQYARCMIVPSISEGFGRITAEAMFNGCLVVGRNTGGTKEQFDNGLEMTGEEIGIRFNETRELINILKDISQNDFLIYEPYVKRAQNVVKKLYSIETDANRVLDFYKRIIEEKK